MIRDTFSDKSWHKFGEQVESRPPGNDGLFGFYFTLKEIIPDGVIGDHFFQNGKRVSKESFSSDAHARAVVESQLLSIRARLIDTLHTTTQSQLSESDSSTFASSAGLKRCIVTGGGSHNPVLQQLAADILGLPVFTAATGGGSAASGGVLLAKYAWWKRNRGAELPTVLGNAPNGLERDGPPTRSSGVKIAGTTFEDMRNSFEELALDRVAQPKIENEHFYGRVLDEFRRCEQVIVDDLRRNEA